jgi:hypothetical protein
LSIDAGSLPNRRASRIDQDLRRISTANIPGHPGKGQPQKVAGLYAATQPPQLDRPEQQEFWGRPS